MDFRATRVLGKTGLQAGRLALAGGYLAPTPAIEEAFERGCNYFYWGSIRAKGMRNAIRNIVARGKRDELIVLLQSYSRSAGLMENFLERGLKELGVDQADILLLGWYNQRPAERILERAERMRQKGRFRFLALSGHHRPTFPRLASQGAPFDIFHVRYNAAHRGAEKDVFPLLPENERPGIVTFTATRWGRLLKKGNAPPGEPPLSASDCYRFALSHPAVDVCMCGPRNQEQMREALRTLELGPLSEEEMQRVRRVGDRVYGKGILWSRKKRGAESAGAAQTRT
jgi:aryl-alcohol dehydrogenase-like predicted oxidoreductase